MFVLRKSDTGLSPNESVFFIIPKLLNSEINTTPRNIIIRIPNNTGSLIVLLLTFHVNLFGFKTNTVNVIIPRNIIMNL